MGFTNTNDANERARGGFESNIGNRRLRWADNDTDVNYFNNEGFNDLGLISGELNINSVVEEFLNDVAVPEVTLGVVKTGEKIPFEFTLVYPTEKAESLAYGVDNPTITYPSPAVATTIDDATAPSTKAILVASATGLTAGTKIVVTVGSSTTGTKFNFTRVKSVATNLLTIEPPLQEVPVDGAAVAKYTNLDWEKTTDDLPSIIKMQYLKNNNQRNEIEITGFLFQPVDGSINDGDGKTPQTVTIRGHVIPELDSANDKYILLKRRVI